MSCCRIIFVFKYFLHQIWKKRKKKNVGWKFPQIFESNISINFSFWMSKCGNILCPRNFKKTGVIDEFCNASSLLNYINTFLRLIHYILKYFKIYNNWILNVYIEKLRKQRCLYYKIVWNIDLDMVYTIKYLADCVKKNKEMLESLKSRWKEFKRR